MTTAFPTQPALRALLLALAVAVLSSVSARSQTSPTPITGAFLPGMERFDAAVLGLMNQFKQCPSPA